MSVDIILILPLVFGAIVGSFLNVCIHRIPLGVSIVSPPSSCPNCTNRIPFYLNVPVISYILLRGRCSACGEPFSARYPVVEAFTALVALFTFLKFGPTPEAAVYFAFLSALIVITFIDLDLKIIPDVISLPGIAAGLLASFFLPYPGVLNSFIGAAAGGGVLFAVAWGYYLATGQEGMGGGDVKLLAMIGAFLGWKGVILTLLIGSFTGALTGALLMLALGKGSRYAVPFGPFLALGAAAHLFFGESIISWYLLKATGG
ncbi:MAG: prepilin peptidase [Thermodesulfobacteriota bacterium]|nr:MAG: prepilin peptidase [Thermodesulfobacteriota bacterium]